MGQNGRHPFPVGARFLTFGRCAPLIPWLLLALAPLYAQPSNDTRSVFVLNSYRAGFGWTDEVLRGMQDLLRQAPFEVETWIEFLDARRDSGVGQRFLRLYRERYASRRFDAVAVTDDDALRLLAEHPHLFPETPVVFSGVNDNAFAGRLPRERYTGRAGGLRRPRAVPSGPPPSPQREADSPGG